MIRTDIYAYKHKLNCSFRLTFGAQIGHTNIVSKINKNSINRLFY